MFSPETLLRMIGPDTVNDLVKQHAPTMLKALHEYLVEMATADHKASNPEAPRTVGHAITMFIGAEQSMLVQVRGYVWRQDGTVGDEVSLGTYSLTAMLQQLDLKALMK